MEGIILSTYVFDGLLQHLVDLEERKDDIIDNLYQQAPRQYQEFTNIFNNYLSALKQTVEKAIKSNTADNNIPFITVGCEVNVTNLDNNKSHSFRIISPFINRVNSNDVSCLSPVGSTLLLKKEGDEVTVNAPSAVFKYKIKSVKYIGE